MKNKMHISQQGIEALKFFEGLRLTVYKDSAGLDTVGYGHLVKPGESFTTITEAEAEQLLKADISYAEDAVNRLVKVDLDQHQYDALVSFVYNVGAGAFADSTLLKRLNYGDYQGAANELDRWNKAGGRVIDGLVSRRYHEKQLFLGIA